jgi:hypothetical protein
MYFHSLYALIRGIMVIMLVLVVAEMQSTQTDLYVTPRCAVVNLDFAFP